jgi:hypothetical protein
VAEVKVTHEVKPVIEQEAPLKGTWISLGVLGLVIFVTYILLFWFFMDRV